MIKDDKDFIVSIERAKTASGEILNPRPTYHMNNIRALTTAEKRAVLEDLALFIEVIQNDSHPLDERLKHVVKGAE